MEGGIDENGEGHPCRELLCGAHFRVLGKVMDEVAEANPQGVHPGRAHGIRIGLKVARFARPEHRCRVVPDRELGDSGEERSPSGGLRCRVQLLGQQVEGEVDGRGEEVVLAGEVPIEG